MQPQAARDRIVMRTSFAPKLPPVVADERSVRQIVLNLVSNAIKFTDAGGQVIVSTALTDRGEVAFRVRDTGIGMTDAGGRGGARAVPPAGDGAQARRHRPRPAADEGAGGGQSRGAADFQQPERGNPREVLFPPTRVLARIAPR